MKKQLVMLLACCAFVVLGAAGCAQEKTAASSGEAINTAKAMATVEEKVDYLVGQANAFYKSDDFQQAVDVAQYILSKVDSESREAKNLLEKAKSALAAKAQQAVDKVAGDVKNKLGSFGQ